MSAFERLNLQVRICQYALIRDGIKEYVNLILKQFSHRYVNTSTKKLRANDLMHQKNNYAPFETKTLEKSKSSPQKRKPSTLAY